MQTITRKYEMDTAHRVMNQKFKCSNMHGHRYVVFMTFSYEEETELGYAIDFAEIKRVACAFMDDFFDHGCILNPKDVDYAQVILKGGHKLWLMSLNGVDYCNPSVENIAKELYILINALMSGRGLDLQGMKIYETPNCYTEVTQDSVELSQITRVLDRHKQLIDDYKEKKGTLEYDDRK